MKREFKHEFLGLWGKYFPGAELPIAFFYTDSKAEGNRGSGAALHRCVIANLARVRQGAPLQLEAGSVGCTGGKRYLGFTRSLRPKFEYFLSCGIPGKLEGERYKKSPALVKKMMKKGLEFKAPKKYIVFKRFDLLAKSENPEAVIFFAPPDVLAGLFTLANFEEEESGVIAPFGAGCGSIVLYPYLERKARRPRCIAGMFDPSARPYVPAGVLSFAAPMNKFVRMVNNMEDSFLITGTWDKIRRRIKGESAKNDQGRRPGQEL
jgi:hypothetical protein